MGRQKRAEILRIVLEVVIKKAHVETTSQKNTEAEKHFPVLKKIAKDVAKVVLSTGNVSQVSEPHPYQFHLETILRYSRIPMKIHRESYSR